MRIFLIDAKEHGERFVENEAEIEKLIKANEPGYFTLKIEDREYKFCGDLGSKPPFRITGISPDMEAQIFDTYAVYKDDMSEEDIEFLNGHMKEMVDPDFDDNYFALIGITETHRIK